jgi:hypothetical protein
MRAGAVVMMAGRQLKDDVGRERTARGPGGLSRAGPDFNFLLAGDRAGEC